MSIAVGNSNKRCREQTGLTKLTSILFISIRKFEIRMVSYRATQWWIGRKERERNTDRENKPLQEAKVRQQKNAL